MAQLNMRTTIGGYPTVLYAETYATINNSQLFDRRIVMVAKDENYNNKTTFYQFVGGRLEFLGNNDIDLDNLGITLDTDVYPESSEVEYDTMGNPSVIRNKFKNKDCETHMEYSNGLLHRVIQELPKGTLTVEYTYRGSNLVSTSTQFVPANS